MNTEQKEKERQAIIDGLEEASNHYRLNEFTTNNECGSIADIISRNLAELHKEETPSEELVDKIQAIMNEFHNDANNLPKKEYHSIKKEDAIRIAKLITPTITQDDFDTMQGNLQTIADMAERGENIALEELDELKQVNSGLLEALKLANRLLDRCTIAERGIIDMAIQNAQSK